MSAAGIASFFILTFRSANIETAAKKLASDPKIKSYGPSADSELILAITQPIVSPGIAAGVKSASIVRISEARN